MILILPPPELLKLNRSTVWMYNQELTQSFLLLFVNIKLTLYKHVSEILYIFHLKHTGQLEKSVEENLCPTRSPLRDL